jgi:dipeptidyl aminopeptidase/acylaminoacyl peptidase
MRHLFLFGFLIIAPTLLSGQGSVTKGNLVMEGIPEIPTALMEKMNQYLNVRSASFEDWAPDGNSILMSTRFGETSQLHIIDHPGGARKQITFFREPVSSGSFCPADTSKCFIFSRDAGGNEFAQLYLFNTANGSSSLISDGGRTQNSISQWSNSRNKFVTVSTRRNGKDYDLYVSEMSDPAKAKIVLQEGGSWSASDWSPDDKQLLVSKYTSADKSQLFLLNLESGQLTEVNPSKEDISYNNAKFTANGNGILMINNQDNEFKVLKYHDIATNKTTVITDKIKWEVVGLGLNKARSQAVFITNEDGLSGLYILNTADLSYRKINGIPEGVINGAKFHPTKNQLAIGLNTATSPGDIFTLSLDNNNLVQWTYSEVGGLNNNSFAKATLIHYPTFDSVKKEPRLIPAFYYKPEKVTGKLPVVINIHGGPEGQSRPSFSSSISYMTNEMGIAVISPNVRGSSGYGKSYLKADNGFLREESVKDIGALIEWIAKQPELDASRIAVYGGSYGGYMVLASLTHFNDKLRCGIDVVGISNFVTFLNNTEEYRRDLRRVEYGDERDPKMNAFLQKISPTNNIDKITKPLFIIQGQNDPRVPVTEAEQMKTKMQEKGGKVWYLLAKDEGHGFRKKTNSDFMQWAVVKFLEENLIQ